MTSAQIEKIVYQSVCTVKKNIKPKELTHKTLLIEDLGFDSLGLVSLASELEKHFKKSLPLSEWVNQQTGQKLQLGSLIQFLSDLRTR